MRMLLATAFTLAMLTGCGGGAENKAGNAAAPGAANGSMPAAPGADANGSAANSAGGTESVALPGGLPAYPGATDVQDRDGTVSFRAPDSWTEVSQYYVRAAETAGYQITRGQLGSSERLTLTRGAETVQITGSVVLGGRSQVEISAGAQ